MDNFTFYTKLGFEHISDLGAYDHILFIVSLAALYSIKQWKPLLFLVTAFTIGHSMALALATFDLVKINSDLIEFLIPVSIILTCIWNILQVYSFKKNNLSENKKMFHVEHFTKTSYFIVTFFGLIHGLGFSNYFKSILPGNASDKLIPSLEFALGIEAAQLIVVFGVLILAYIVQTFFRFSKKDWALVMSAFVIGVVLPMIIESEIWNK